MSSPDVVVYGATGVVGRRICRALTGTSFTTAGRDTAPADDPAALAHAFRGADVVINAASGVTEPIVVAALAAGAHVVDTGGSQDITHAIYERHESTARHAGRVCVLGAGLDCTIGDLAASWAAVHVCGASDLGDTIRDRPMPRLAADRPLDDVAISYIYDDLVLSPSSQRALFSRLSARPLVWKRDRWESVTAGAERRRVNAGREMGERDVVSFPGGDVISVPRHLASKSVQTFVSTTRSAAATTGLRLLARAMPFVPKRAADLLAPYAFADDDYARTRFAVVVQARRGFAAAQVVVSGSDIYGTTAAIAAWIGRALVGRPQGPLGMRAPSELFRAEPALREIAANASLTIEPGFG
jgi:hypothetical protein